MVQVSGTNFIQIHKNKNAESENTYHRNDLTEVTGNLQMTLVIFISVRNNNLRSSLSYAPGPYSMVSCYCLGCGNEEFAPSLDTR